MDLYRIKDYQNSLVGPRVGPLICGVGAAECFVSRLKWLYRNLSGGLYVNSENFLPVVGRVDGMEPDLEGRRKPYTSLGISFELTVLGTVRTCQGYRT